jgi:hypothetical protein
MGSNNMNKPRIQKSALFTVPDQARSRTSDVVASLIERSQQGDVTLRNLTSRFGDRTFGLLLVLMAVFNFIPLVSIPAGILVSLLGMQMVLGVKVAKLPNFILDRALSSGHVLKALQFIEPKVRNIEKYIRPRWHFTEAPIVDRVNGLVIAVLGIIIAIPIPFTNLPPSFVVILMGMGLLERDGLVQVLAAGLGGSILIVSLVYFII